MESSFPITDQPSLNQGFAHRGLRRREVPTLGSGLLLETVIRGSQQEVRPVA